MDPRTCLLRYVDSSFKPPMGTTVIRALFVARRQIALKLTFPHPPTISDWIFDLKCISFEREIFFLLEIQLRLNLVTLASSYELAFELRLTVLVDKVVMLNGSHLHCLMLADRYNGVLFLFFFLLFGYLTAVFYLL